MSLPATQSIIDERKERWRQLHDPRSARRRVFMIYCSEETWPASPPPDPEHTAGRADSAIEACRLQQQRLEWLDDDSLPYMNVYAPTHLFASAFGCEVFTPEGAGSWIRPLITKGSQVAALQVPDLSHPVLAALFDIAEEARRRLGPDVLLKLPDIQSPMDIAAQVWEKTAFYYGLTDAPEAVKELASKCRELLTAFGDEWFRRFGPEFIAHYPDCVHVHDVFPVDTGYLEWFDNAVPEARIVVRPYVQTRREAVELAVRMREWAG